MHARLGLKVRDGVVLAPLAREHAEKMYRWMCDPVVRGNIGLRSDPSMERTVAWIASAAEDDTIRPFAVLLDDEHVGNVILDRIDWYLQTARLSIYVGEPGARGAGVGSSALRLALVEGFAHMTLHKIWLTVHARNFAAITTYSRVGFRLEGILRDEFLLNAERVDLLYMAMLRGEFEAAVAGQHKG